MTMTDLAEPLLNRQQQEPPKIALLQLQVIRHNAFQSTIRSKHGDVVIRLSKPRPFNPFCGLDWQLRDELNADAPSISVKAAMFSGAVSFEAATDTVQTTTARKNEVSTSYVEWQGSRYRWDSIGTLAPLKLKLINTQTGEHVACLQGSTSMPWSRQQQHISMYGRDDHVWVLLVVASGLAEAKRLGGENSCTAPRRSAVK